MVTYRANLIAKKGFRLLALNEEYSMRGVEVGIERSKRVQAQ